MTVSTLVAAALCWQAAGPLPAFRHARQHAATMAVVDLFPDPPSVAGVLIKAKDSKFPLVLEQPTDIARSVPISAPNWLQPGTLPFDPTDVLLAPLDVPDLGAALFVGIALQLGPDFLLAPAGLVSDKGGLRPGRILEEVIGAAATPDAQWLRDRREKLAASAPLAIRALVFFIFAAAGLPVGRVLQLVFEDQNFVVSIGICACIGGGFLELIREPLPTREERDTDRKLLDEFLAFASQRVLPGGRCHQNDIVREFRLFYPRYRRRDMGRSKDGVNLSDDKIGDLVSSWNREVGGPGQRTPSGYWKGISVNATQVVRYI